jgi:hypothetical protein
MHFDQVVRSIVAFLQTVGNMGRRLRHRSKRPGSFKHGCGCLAVESLKSMMVSITLYVHFFIWLTFIDSAGSLANAAIWRHPLSLIMLHSCQYIQASDSTSVSPVRTMARYTVLCSSSCLKCRKMRMHNAKFGAWKSLIIYIPQEEHVRKSYKLRTMQALFK